MEKNRCEIKVHEVEKKTKVFGKEIFKKEENIVARKYIGNSLKKVLWKLIFQGSGKTCISTGKALRGPNTMTKSISF